MSRTLPLSLFLKRIAFFTFSLLIVAFPFLSNPQSAFAAQTVSVIVGNGAGGNIAGAYVSANGGIAGGCTTSSFGCSINLPSAGTYTIRASYGSMIPASRTVTVGTGQFVSIRLELSYGDGTGGAPPPQPTTPPVSNYTTIQACITQNGTRVNGTVQLVGYSEVATTGGCYTFNVFKNQTVTIDARAKGFYVRQSQWVGTAATYMTIPIPTSPTSDGTGGPQTTPIVNQAQPKRIEGSILSATGAVYRSSVTVSLKNVNSGQVGKQTTTNGSYAFTGLAGGTQRYEVSAVTSSGQQLVGTDIFTLTSGTKFVNFRVQSSPTSDGTGGPQTTIAQQPKTITGSILQPDGSLYKKAITITLKNTGTGQTDSQTVSTGSYSFTGLRGGTQSYSVSAELLPLSGYTVINPVSFSLSSGTYRADIRLKGTGGATAAPTKAPTQAAGQGQISGTVFLKSAAGTKPFLQSVRITATNRVPQSKSVTTNASNGTYVISDLNAKYYDVQIVIPSGYRATTAVTQPADFSNTSSRVINYTIESTGATAVPTKAPTKAPTSDGTASPQTGQKEISGKVTDTSTAGPYLSGVSVVATNSEDKSKTVTANANGTYKITGLNATWYNVSLVLPSNKKAVSGDPQRVEFTNNKAVANFTITNVDTPSATKVNYTVKVQDVRGGPIKDVLVLVGPGPGLYYTNAQGTVTAPVDKNSTISISASKDGLTSYNETGIKIGTSNITKVVTLEGPRTTVVPSKVTLTVKVQDVRGGAIPDARVGIGPEGPGLYYTNPQGIVTASVGSNSTISLTAAKDGYTVYSATNIKIGTSNTTKVVTLEGGTSVLPTKPPVQNKKRISGKILNFDGSLYTTKPVTVTLTNERTSQVAKRETQSGKYEFNNLNSVEDERYSIRAEASGATFSDYAPFTIQPDQELYLDFYHVPGINEDESTPTTIPNLGTLDSPSENQAAASISDFTVSLQGISDVPDPAPSQLTRPVTLSFYDNEELVEKVDGYLAYDETTGNFEGEVTLPTTLSGGEYTTRITSPGYLTEQTPETVTVTAGETITIPQVTLTAGDIDQDNQLTILDYTQILDCYSDIQAARNCSEEKLKLADLTDDGVVNQFDYNLFIRNLLNNLN